MISDFLRSVSLYIDDLTGVRGASGYICIVAVVLLGHSWMNERPPPSKPIEDKQPEEEEEADPPRNFTAKQLAYFDGTKDEKTEEEKPVYLSVNGIVFDVSDGRNFYGPDGPYEAFAGHECGVALARMSFEKELLDDLAGCEKLNFGERTELEGWIEKFTYYRNYPVKGRLVPDSKLQPLAGRVLGREDLAKHTGSKAEVIPEGYAAPPIYIGAGEKAFDASFGGAEFYGAGGGYNKFAGRDISRALAKMSFDPADLENISIDDLDEKQKKVLNDWVATFEKKKGYPVVGILK